MSEEKTPNYKVYRAKQMDPAGFAMAIVTTGTSPFHPEQRFGEYWVAVFPLARGQRQPRVEQERVRYKGRNTSNMVSEQDALDCATANAQAKAVWLLSNGHDEDYAPLVSWQECTLEFFSFMLHDHEAGNHIREISNATFCKELAVKLLDLEKVGIDIDEKFGK